MNVASIAAGLRWVNDPHRNRVVVVREPLRHLLHESRQHFDGKLVRQRYLDITHDRRVHPSFCSLDGVNEGLLITRHRRRAHNLFGPDDTLVDFVSVRTPSGPVVVHFAGAKTDESLPGTVGPRGRDGVSAAARMGPNSYARDAHADALPDARCVFGPKVITHSSAK